MLFQIDNISKLLHPECICNDIFRSPHLRFQIENITLPKQHNIVRQAKLGHSRLPSLLLSFPCLVASTLKGDERRK